MRGCCAAPTVSPARRKDIQAAPSDIRTVAYPRIRIVEAELAELTGNTVLCRAPDLVVDLGSPARPEVRFGGKAVRSGRHLLAVLDAFGRPIRLEDGLATLRPRATGPHDWMEMTTTVVRLVEVGVLQPQGAAEAAVSADPSNFDAAQEQASMLNDRTRTSRFLDAVAGVVRPGDVVVEIGTGTGILSIGAARAGARRVYAIEAGSVAGIAREMFEANGVADRVTLLEGWSTELKLPERADVLVSEVIGNRPLHEGVLEYTGDAVRRLLKPGARLVPSGLRLLALPVEVPGEVLGTRTFSGEAVARWREWYDMDFTPLHPAAAGSPHFSIFRSRALRDWRPLGDPVPLVDLRLADAPAPRISARGELVATRSGRLSGLVEFFELELAPGVRLSTHPAEADEANSWGAPVWLFPDAPAVEAGDRFEVGYRYRAEKRTDGVTLSRASSAGPESTGRESAGDSRSSPATSR